MPCTPVYLSPYRFSGILSWIDHIRQFSPFYQEFLTGTVKYQASAGKPINYSGKRVKDSFKVKIGEITAITYEGINYEVLMSSGTIHIKTGEIMAPVCSAPAGFSKAKKASFLKSVVRTLIEDPENIYRYMPATVPQGNANQGQPAPAVFPVPDGWIPHLKLSITEEMIPA